MRAWAMDALNVTVNHANMIPDKYDNTKENLMPLFQNLKGEFP